RYSGFEVLQEIRLAHDLDGLACCAQFFGSTGLSGKTFRRPRQPTQIAPVCAGTTLPGAFPTERGPPPESSDMDGISPTGSLVSRMRELENGTPSPSIADVAGPDTPAASDFTARYEMAALVTAFRANADMSLTLIQMLNEPRSPVE
ncbi:MAG TPA: hypothetical protein VF375_04530, partial [Candidatus Limnocylindrales bacterium]